MHKGDKIAKNVITYVKICKDMQTIM